MKILGLPGPETIWITVLTALFVADCTQTAPLSITLKDPKTNAVRTCAAREFGKSDTAFLASAVEACAKQLEGYGFVRVND